MSDVGVLSHEYKTASDLSQVINRNLLALKKVCLGLPGAETISATQVEASRGGLVEVLAALIGLLDPARATAVTGPGITRVPGAVVARLRTERRGDLEYYLQDLERVAARLRAGLPKDADLATLDYLASVADAEASSVFRRLMRT